MERARREARNESMCNFSKSQKIETAGEYDTIELILFNVYKYLRKVQKKNYKKTVKKRLSVSSQQI